MLYGAMNFPVRSILQELETISRLGFDYLELTMDPPKAITPLFINNETTYSKNFKNFK